MALLIRTADAAPFVHEADPDALAALRPSWWPAGDPWLPAQGQSEGATRVVVRAMSQHERAAAASVWEGVTVETAAPQVEAAATEWTRIVWACVLSVGGEPVGAEEVDPGLRVAIARLVSQVSSGAYGPLGRC